jgi:hypothetical protein
MIRGSHDPQSAARLKELQIQTVQFSDIGPRSGAMIPVTTVTGKRFLIDAETGEKQEIRTPGPAK